MPETVSLTTANDPVNVAQWRRAVCEMYADVRAMSVDEPVRAVDTFRKTRDMLFAMHAASPIPAARRARFKGLNYFSFDPAYRVVGTIARDVEQTSNDLTLPTDGLLRYTRIGRVHFALGETAAALNIFWIEGYGGGLFLPFRDTTNGRTTYGGGRYLYDTIKGADLGIDDDTMVLDFNYAYNPSCAYSENWICPLPPPENQLSFPVKAGELVFDNDSGLASGTTK